MFFEYLIQVGGISEAVLPGDFMEGELFVYNFVENGHHFSHFSEICYW